MNKTLQINGQEVVLESLRQQAGAVQFTISGVAYHFRSHALPDGRALLEQEVSTGIWKPIALSITALNHGKKRVEIGSISALVTERVHGDPTQHVEASLSPPAPMPGLVRKLLVSAGEEVVKGQPIAVMEAMKLQLTLNAGGDATVEKLLVSEGELIAEGALLVQLKAKAAE